MKWLDTYWWKGISQFLGVEISELEDGYQYVVAQIEKTKTGVNLSNREVFYDVERFQEYLQSQRKRPILLNLMGSFVMEAVVNDRKNALYEVLGVRVDKVDDFCLKMTDIGKGKKVAAVIRRDQMASLLAVLGDVRERLISVELSPSVVGYLLPQLVDDLSNKEVVFEWMEHSYAVSRGQFVDEEDADGWQEIHLKHAAQRIGIAGEELCLMAHAVRFLFYPESSGITPEIAHQRKDYLGLIRFQRILLAASIAIGLILAYAAGSYFYFDSQRESLQSYYAANQETLDVLKENREKMNERQELLKNLTGSTLKRSKVAHTLDQIAAEQTEGVAFIQLFYQPNEEEKRKLSLQDQEEVEYVILGQASRSTAIADFALKLEQADFTENVEVVNSTYNFQQEYLEFVMVVEVKE